MLELRMVRDLLTILVGLVLTLGLTSCSSPPKLSSVSISPASPFSSQEFVATTNVPDGADVLAHVRDAAGRDHGLYQAVAAKGQLSLMLDLPQGTYSVEFTAPSCFPVHRTITTGMRIPTSHIEFVFGDVDNDGQITADDIDHLTRWMKTGGGMSPSDSDIEKMILPWQADWDRDRKITHRDIEQASKNLGRKR